MGIPREPLLSLACLSSQTSLTTGWWVQTWHSCCARGTDYYDERQPLQKLLAKL